ATKEEKVGILQVVKHQENIIEERRKNYRKNGFKMSEKIDLTGEQIVMGNRKDQLQLYQIFYYPPEKTEKEKRVDKTAVYFYLKNKEGEGKPYARRSVYFAEIPQYRHFIIDNIKAYFNWLDKRIKPAIPRSKYRQDMLIGLLQEIKEMMFDEWRNNH
ncbi:unnamed protein product, partial [marine sediment metagenome]